MTLRVEVWAEVRNTEDVEKVAKAVMNVTNFSREQLKLVEVGGKRYLVGSGEGYFLLMKVYRKIREQETHDAAREVLRRGVERDRVVFHVHKQAAYRGYLVFVTVPEKESPLGPITFIVHTSNPRQLLDWLAPKTVDGKIVYEAPPPD